MALLKIFTWPDPVLKKVAEPLPGPSDELRQLAADMRETMYAAPGVGLAAPQIGRSIRLIVVDPTAGQEEGHFRAVLNPEIVERSGEIVFEEGCLSVPGEVAEVKRSEKIRLQGMDLDGKPIDEALEGFPAVIFQHEIDHLDGKLFIDRISALKRAIIQKRLKKGTRPPARSAQSAL
ncbi:MAG: peptide deformylase [Bdellovibrionota bacterium]